MIQSHTLAAHLLKGQLQRGTQRFLSQPMAVAEVFTGNPGKYVPVEKTIEGFKAIVNGEVDDLPEAAFFMVGDIEEAKAKAAAMQKE